jgi:hypothetical protein
MQVTPNNPYIFSFERSGCLLIMKVWAVFCRRTRRRRGFGRLEIDARDLDDGVPRGFLAGAIGEVWLALHLNRA